MQYERIEIDYKPIDLGDSSLNINIKSNILKKVSDYSCSYSYTYDVPLTIRNKSILGELLIMGANNKKVRKFLPATYYRDGLKIFDGKCYVSEVGLDTASLVFLFGINNALQALKSDDVSLDKLWNDEDNEFHSVSESTGININYVTRKLPLSDYDDVLKFADMSSADESTLTCPAVALRNTYGQLSGTWQYWPYAQRIPYAMRITSIFEQLNKRYDLEVSNLFEDGGRYLDDYLYFKTNMRRKGAFKLNSNAINPADVSYYCKTSYAKLDGVITSDSMLIKDSDGNYPDATFDGQVLEHLNSSADIKKVTFKWHFGEDCPCAGQFVYSCGDGAEYEIGTFQKGESSGTIEFVPREKNFAHEMTSGKLAYISALSVDTYPEAPGVLVFKVTFEMEFDDDNATQGLFNIFDTLPSTNAVTFISDYAFCKSGKFPLNTMKGGNTLTFTSLEEIANKTPYNWSDKLQSKDLKVYHTIDGLARKNWLKYAEDESETFYEADHAFDKCINVDDATLEDEDDYFESITSYAVAHTDNECWFLERREDTSEDLNPQPRYMHLTSTKYLNFDGTNYAQMLNSTTLLTTPSNHQVLLDTLADPMRIECKLALNTIDLATLDMSRPVYLGQFGALFFIEEIKVGSDDIATAKLTRLKV